MDAAVEIMYSSSVCSTVDVVVQDVIIRRNAFYRFDEHYHYQLTATGT